MASIILYENDIIIMIIRTASGFYDLSKIPLVTGLQKSQLFEICFAQKQFENKNKQKNNFNLNVEINLFFFCK